MPFSSSASASIVGAVEFDRKSVVLDGFITGYLEAGTGAPVVLLPGGEFGASTDAHSAVIEAAGHCPQIEPPEVVNDLLLEFLEGGSAS